MKVDIRDQAPTPADFNRLRDAMEWGAILPIERAETALRNSLFCVTARVGREVVGMARVVGDGGYAFHIHDVIVMPDYQRKGIGRLLMSRVMDWFDHCGIEQANIGLMASSDTEAFYARFGFVARPNPRHGAGMTIFREIHGR